MGKYLVTTYFSYCSFGRVLLSERDVMTQQIDACIFDRYTKLQNKFQLIQPVVNLYRVKNVARYCPNLMYRITRYFQQMYHGTRYKIQNRIFHTYICDTAQYCLGVILQHQRKKFRKIRQIRIQYCTVNFVKNDKSLHQKTIIGRVLIYNKNYF